MNPKSLETLLAELGGSVTVTGDGKVSVPDEKKLRGAAIDTMAKKAVFGDSGQKAAARWLLWEVGQVLGVYPASIHELYTARGRGEVPVNFTVPAINLRAMAYDSARAVFRAALPRRVGALIFEIARSEIGYTDQRPAEYFSVVMAAAIKEGYRGPLFVQGDHFQVNAKKFKTAPEAEVQAVSDLADEAIRAGFYNIDIDTSTLVDLSQPTVDEQQRNNYEVCANLTAFIREREPEGITISVGGEIGEIGEKNSDETELRAYMDGYYRSLPKGMIGLSKISIQTGTTHGGVPLPDGTLAQVKIDFNVIKELSRVARKVYGMAGAVQHGASTLPDEAFNQFVQNEAAEVHLATGFQNIVYDHEAMPKELRERIYEYIKTAHANEKKEGQTEEQFIYKMRKKGLGPFKADLWGLAEDVRGAIRTSLEEKFGFLFDQLNVGNTIELAIRYAPHIKIHKSLADYTGKDAVEEDTSELAD
ncbi:MAG: class II fructose-bisphosphate aldolase [Deltaproteobacteria bacterium]|nr:class II fructose-bisphosphate aldolase [Deltaproteobacteria bacterium]MBW2018707.1 class II fructose-bisphosphate aldolase [Deltaproteobacteria bacterium]MBW2073436.1 class II fructose-bisphosphate aldolase [Deltaproteobacteria bacterium]